MQLSVYPNPASQNITVSIADNHHLSGGTVILTDITGRFIARTKPENGIAVIDISYLPGGVYVLKYQDETGSATMRLLKE